MVPLALVLRNAPRPAPGTTPPATTYAVSRARLLALLSLAVVLCCFCMATPIVHVVALGADRGLAASDAAGLLATLMLFGMAGRVAFGRIADRIGNLRAYIAASAGQTLVAFLFPYAETRVELYALSALFGLVFSGAMTAFILCAREYAPPGTIGRSMGIVMCFAWLGMAIGAWQGGLFYDLCGTYFPSFANASLGGVANLVVLAVLSAWTRPVRPAGPAAPRFAAPAAGASQRAA
jgi:predicted MFS family arabinose efflux permease